MTLSSRSQIIRHLSGMDPSIPAYAELHCCSSFSFLQGASFPEELVERAATLGYSALAITDECSMAGVVRAHAEAKKAGLHLLIGSQFILEDGLRLVCLAMNRNGYGNLCELITLARQRAEKGTYRIGREDFERRTAGDPVHDVYGIRRRRENF